MEVSLAWLLNFIEQLYLTTPEDLQFIEPTGAEIEVFCLEADELWSFVAKRANKRWIWLMLERRTRQIIALHIGDRSADSAACALGESSFIAQNASVGLDRLLGRICFDNSRQSARRVSETKRTSFFD